MKKTPLIESVILTSYSDQIFDLARYMKDDKIIVATVENRSYYKM